MTTTETPAKRRKTESSYRPRQSSLIPRSTNPLNEDGTSKCFHKVETSLYVSLAPSYIQDPIQGIRTQHLDPLVMTYFAPAKGIVLGYFDIKLGSENRSTDSDGNSISVARITHDTPFAFLWVSVEFLVWRPQVGDTVEGWIYMQTQSHIGLLIHDCFNASIKKFNIPSNWTYIPNQADELDYSEEQGVSTGDANSGNESSNSGNRAGKIRSLGHWEDENGVSLDGKLRFYVKALHTAGRVVSVEGSVVAPGSESDSLPVTVSKQQHKKFDDTVVSAVPIVESKDMDEITAIPTYAKNSDDEVVAEEDSSSSDDSDSD